jgi:hypothetical protein
MSTALFMELLLSDPNVSPEFKFGAAVGFVSHELSAESRQELDSDHFEEMGMEARERELMEDDDE